jgi:DNA primase catalytic subunit
VLAYWQIGREIVEYYQGGAVRAEYGDQLLEMLSAQLAERVGRRYSATNLRYFRLFYQTYAEREQTIRHKPRDELRAVPGKHHKARDVSAALERAVAPGATLAGFSGRLSWSHYRTLTKVTHPAERAFSEIEAELGDWSVPHPRFG